ncbi:putative cobalamin binding protein [Desulfosporosinus orientis DSM 765]|uniref:Putative cobalamin binding protein n=1 Tax=Desulfosporosinus orientis (strain ATCC 19365 / DSM 765 / NCIMB 8382 / VKM B-1628 / Singapore I) TaxID=768706 RepID=G7WDY8_DESOD|nr:cobalamin-dependent protein [Desulfosporosinus orientis]AET69386.1 putative cobalamin binding protein [Desulfosporosinus orientis DSM 765]
MKDELQIAMADLDEEKTLMLVEERIRGGHTPLQIIESCRRGVEIVGEKYSDSHYYLSDLIMSEEILKGVMRVLEPYIPMNGSEKGISIVMGTIEGDIHDLGKNIVIYLLRSSGYKVHDLGVDVTPERFVQAVNETKASILGISVLISFCVGSIKRVVELLAEAGLRDKVKVVVGGYPVNQDVKEFTGADFYANDVTEALKIYRDILEINDSSVSEL